MSSSPVFKLQNSVGNDFLKPNDYSGNGVSNSAVFSATPVSSSHYGAKQLSKAVLFIFILVCITLLIVVVFAVFETPKQIIKEICHKSCLRKGPCKSGNCPAADPSNPVRSIIKHQEAAEECRQEIQEIHFELARDAKYISEDLKKTLQSSIDGNIVATKNNVIVANNIAKSINQLAVSAMNIGTSTTGKSKMLILAHQKVAGLASAMNILRFLSIIQLRMYETRLLYTKIDKEKIDIKELSDAILNSDYEKKKESFEKLVKKTATTVGDITTPDSEPSIYNASETMISVGTLENTELEKIISTVSVLADYESAVIPILVEVENTSSYIKKVYEETHESFTERFESKQEPGKVATDIANQQIENNDYNSTIMQLSLEPSIKENHKVFAAERNRIDSGSSILGVRQDPNDVIPWVGLFRPTYKRSDGTSAEDSQVALKSVPSDDPEKQMQERMRLTF